MREARSHMSLSVLPLPPLHPIMQLVTPPSRECGIGEGPRCPGGVWCSVTMGRMSDVSVPCGPGRAWVVDIGRPASSSTPHSTLGLLLFSPRFTNPPPHTIKIISELLPISQDSWKGRIASHQPQEKRVPSPLMLPPHSWQSAPALHTQGVSCLT